MHKSILHDIGILPILARAMRIFSPRKGRSTRIAAPRNGVRPQKTLLSEKSCKLEALRSVGFTTLQTQNAGRPQGVIFKIERPDKVIFIAYCAFQMVSVQITTVRDPGNGFAVLWRVGKG